MKVFQLRTLHMLSRLGLVFSVLSAGALAVAADEVRVIPAHNWSTAFAGGEVTYGVRVISAGGNTAGTISWSHSAEMRTLARGEVVVRRSEPVSGTADFVLKTPPLRDGVIFETTVSVQFQPQGSTKSVASMQQPLWLFPNDPIGARTEWAEKLEIELYDPTGDTQVAFDELKLPYRRLRNAAVVADPKQKGILVIGEGTALRNSLIEDLLKAANSGRRVVVLAPDAGTFPIDDGQKEGSPAELRFARHHVIRELDKRLDTGGWPGTKDTIPVSGLLIESNRGRVEATVSDDVTSWPWLEIRASAGRGRIVFCGYQIIEHIEAGPTPRFLLVRLLESLTKRNN